ncbi:hypothetical protein ACFSQ7_46055 [Paenibacillus rhizoplanae]
MKELLDADSSYITIHEVFVHLHLKRQEWLDPYISGGCDQGQVPLGQNGISCSGCGRIPPLAAAPAGGVWLPVEHHCLRPQVQLV